MSDFHCEVVRLKNVTKHPNADTLSIGDANGNPVIFRTGESSDGDLAAYIPIDAIVPECERFAFLNGHRRIKAKRLRGVSWSESLMDLAEGQSMLGSHVTEGFVVRPTKERIADHFGRVVLKMVGQGYLLRKSA